MSSIQPPELVCPAGTPAGLRTAVDAGADAVYCGFQGPTNARNFPGLNFTPEQMAKAVDYAHERDAKVLAAINSFPTAGRTHVWKEAVDAAVACGVDAIIIADIGMARYLSTRHPQQRIHLSVQAGASSAEAIRFWCDRFDVKRVVLPRILTVAEIKQIHDAIPCEIEAFVFGNIGMMAEGRCALTNYVTGCSTNLDGVCSPAGDVHYEEDRQGNLTSSLRDVTIDRFAQGEHAGYPTICKGRYSAPHREHYYAFEEPVSLNLTHLLADLVQVGVTALKIEGRQRSRAYVRSVVSAFRGAVDDYAAGRTPDVSHLLALTEGQRETQGAFRSKTWR
ncbi:ubiquinone anaerobic biosynthesis protein UbiU [Hoeflea prorocentri]|uniref:U32 family peptidase n=1 Tax=Hoeflea prorocentri TaxID=1922333 RepID=A0A9X3UIB6_9HYPH|nr:peptidase U32 family protein [Hoeflea prorocentri]MCY6381131.1 U32 family peptidase [Hoeflea prorocentri]MDA5398931.1 U32 family peptidase [Hoeflea prorocentri]